MLIMWSWRCRTWHLFDPSSCNSLFPAGSVRMSFEFLDSRWIIRMPKFSYFCEYNACPAKQPSGLSWLSCTCKDDLYVCPVSVLSTHTLPLFTLSMYVCVFAAFIVVLMHPRDHLTSQWSFSVTLVCFMWCLRLWLFLFHADDPIIDLLSNWGV